MILEIPPYAPDLSDYEARGTLTLSNVLPRSDGYGPFQDFQALTGAITSPGVSGDDEDTFSLLTFDGTFTDTNTGGASHTWTPVANAQIDLTEQYLGIASMRLDGTSDYLQGDGHADFAFGTGDYTVECFFKVSSFFGGGFYNIFDFRSNGTSQPAPVLNIQLSTAKLGIFFNGATVITGTTTIVENQWYHVALTRTGTNTKLFLDGVQEGATFTSDSNSYTVGANRPLIGGDAGGSGDTFAGNIDHWRVSKGLGRYTTTFDPDSSFSDGTVEACRGYFCARKNDGSVAIFAGSSTRLYLLDNTTLTWTDVSKSGNYSAVPTNDQWQFAQFNNFVFAVQIGTAPQVIDLTSPTAFADLAGSPPPARYITVVNRFLVLSGLGSSTPYRVHWSGFNDTTEWTAGTNQSDTYDMPDGGIVRSIAGGEYGIVTQDSTIRRMVYSPGSPVVFQFDRISEEKGILAPLSMVRGGDRVFYYGNDGFQMVPPGAYPQPIGKERVDRYFARTADLSAPQYIIGAADPRAGRVFWSFRTAGSSVSAFDHLLCYDYVLDKWSVTTMNGEYMATVAAPGVTLESLDAIAGSIDAMAFSLDDISTSSLAQLSIFNTEHKLGFFSGDNLEATLVTAEKSGDGRRLRVRGFRPVSDAINVYGSVSKREGLNDMAQFSTETLINVHGVCPANVSTRNARGKLRVPAGEDWTYVTGIEPDVAIEGRR